MRNDMPDDLADCKTNPQAPHNKSWFAVANDLLGHEVVGAFVAAPAASDKSRPAWTPMHTWIWMLGTAAYKTKEKAVDGEPVVLRRGQLALSGRLLADKANWTHKAARCFLDRLEKHGMATLSNPLKKGQIGLDLWGTSRGTPKGTPCTILTICNYDKYQHAPEPKGTPKGTSRAPQLHTLTLEIEDRSPKTTNVGVVARAETTTLLWGLTLKELSDTLVEAAGAALARHNPGLIMVNSFPAAWHTAGCDLQLDVLPVIRALSAKSIQGKGPGKVGTWNFFTSRIYEARDDRLSGRAAPPEVVTLAAERERKRREFDEAYDALARNRQEAERCQA